METGNTCSPVSCQAGSSEYCIAKIEGRAPRWGGDGSQTTETDEIDAKLRALGWRTGGCKCGLGKGESRDCVVVYICEGQVVHAAVMDRVRGDWGGKLSAGGPIARYRHPEDYFEEGAPPAGCSMRFYCPANPSTVPQKPDDWLHDNAVDLG